MESFLRALQVEISMYAHLNDGEKFETIFFGGGTPSLLSPATIREILGLLKSTFTVTSDAEITLETNPGTVDARKLAGYRESGVNRLSFGVQSFHDDDLRFLTRIHSSSQAREVIRLAEHSGFDNTSLDLIFALPNQTMKRWQENLDQAVDLGTKHISAYSLIVERNTPLFGMVESRSVSTLPVGEEAEMYAFTMEFLRSAGFEHYEVSNYAKPGFHSRHNCNYWNHANYLGFGPSAHSFWNGRRWWNGSNIKGYEEKIVAGLHPVSGEETLTKEQFYDEAIMLGLRSGGISYSEIHTKHGIDLQSTKESFIDSLIGEGLAESTGSLLRLTDRGFLLCDEVTRRLLSGSFSEKVTTSSGH